MNKLIICLMMGIVLLTFVNAGDSDYIGKQWEHISIIETCSDDGFQCDATYTCNITVVDPDHDVIVLNQAMTRNDTIYNYTLTDTEELGIYKIKTYCGNVTFSGENLDGTLDITTTGRTSQFKINLFLVLGGLLLFGLAVYLRSHALGLLSGFLFLIAGVYFMIYGLGDMSDLYTRSIAGIIIALGAVVTISAGYEWLKEVE